MTAKTLVIHTDGACHGNPGPGGYGAFWELDGHRWEILGGMRHTTNNQMELGAVIAALRACKLAQSQGMCPPISSLVIRSDSQYVIKGSTQWRHNWKKKGWRGSDGKPVKNLEIWQALDALLDEIPHAWSMEWVKGHSGDPHNEHADTLAQEGVGLARASKQVSVHTKRKIASPAFSSTQGCVGPSFR